MQQISRTLRCLAPVLVLALCFVPIACQEDGPPSPTLVLSVNPAEIPADGRSFSLITATTTNVPDQSSIVFGTSLNCYFN